MTKHELVVISAYTGFLLCDDFGDMHEYIEQILGRPVWTHELADPKIIEEIREKARPELMRICEEATEDEAGISA